MKSPEERNSPEGRNSPEATKASKRAKKKKTSEDVGGIRSNIKVMQGEIVCLKSYEEKSYDDITRMVPDKFLLKSSKIKINGIFSEVMYLKKNLNVINCNFGPGIDRDGPRHIALILEFYYSSLEPKECTSPSNITP
ncbi:hypothetical protein V6N12_045897 [Hibiscus sabdariffa]|uniref:Uncharacterized protein n=1 Tax=Hibiscus sabdariffa TaxID=183260 RepID=A0ABR2G4Q4_9ROSI